MRLRKIKYKIASVCGPLEVEGYAIESNLPVRLCVRLEGYFWRIDHYDTGYFIGKLCDTRQQAIAHGIEVVGRNLQSGKYAKSIQAYNRNPGVIIGVPA